MRRNVFTSYIICNCLNFETFFEPIIDFIEIGKIPLWEPYMRISSRTAQAEKHPKISCNGYVRESLKLLNLWRYEVRNIRKFFFVAIMPKFQVGSIVFILILTGLLNPLFSYLFFFDLCLCVMWLYFFVFFIIDRNSLVKTLWID